MNDLQNIVTVAHKPNPIQHATGILARDDFQTLVEPVQNKIQATHATSSVNEHNQMIVAMSAVGMANMETPGFKQVLLTMYDFDWNPVVHPPQIAQMPSIMSSLSIWDSAVKHLQR